MGVKDFLENAVENFNSKDKGGSFSINNPFDNNKEENVEESSKNNISKEILDDVRKEFINLENAVKKVGRLLRWVGIIP